MHQPHRGERFVEKMPPFESMEPRSGETKI